MSSQKIGDMPDDVGNYIQNFLRPDLVKEKQKKILKIFHKKLKSFEYCDCDIVCGCPCPDVIQRLDNYKDSEIFFTTCNYKVRRLGFTDFHKSFMMWYRTASGEFSESFPLSEYYPEFERDIEEMYIYIGVANGDFSFWRYGDDIDGSLSGCDFLKHKYNYLI